MIRRGKPSSAIHANMTPMIDVTFLLIVFFVVVSQIVDREAVSMDLPKPDRSVAGVPEETNCVVVNIVPSEEGEIAGFVVGGHSLGVNALGELTEIVRIRMQGGATDVHLRADRSTKYTHIHQTIEAIRNVGTTPRLQLVVSGEER